MAAPAALPSSPSVKPGFAVRFGAGIVVEGGKKEASQ